MIYYKDGANSLAESTKISEFYLQLLQLVKDNWKKSGNSLIEISDDKMYRILSGKQRDFETLVKMAEFMKVSFRFKAF